MSGVLLVDVLAQGRQLGVAETLGVDQQHAGGRGLQRTGVVSECMRSVTVKHLGHVQCPLLGIDAVFEVDLPHPMMVVNDPCGLLRSANEAPIEGLGGFEQAVGERCLVASHSPSPSQRGSVALEPSPNRRKLGRLAGAVSLSVS